MNDEVTCPEVKTKTTDEVRNFYFDMRGKLDMGELLTGAPTVTASPSGLTISNVALNVATITKANGDALEAGQAIQCNISGGVAGTGYLLVAACGTNATPAANLMVNGTLLVVGD